MPGLVAAFVLIASACGQSAEVGDCPAQVAWQGQIYSGSGTRLRPEPGIPLAGVTRAVCNEATDDEVTANRLRGVEPEIALVVADDPSSVYLSPRYAGATGQDLPRPLAHVLLGPKCGSSSPFRIEGELIKTDDPALIQLEVTSTDDAGGPYDDLILDVLVSAETSDFDRYGALREFSDGDVFGIDVECVPAPQPNRTFRAQRLTFLANGRYCGRNGLPCHDPQTGEPIRQGDSTAPTSTN